MPLLGKIFFTFLLSIAQAMPIFAQYELLQKFIPLNYSILANASGDFDRDGKKDLVVILRNRFEQMNSDTTRPLLLLAGDGKGRYHLLARNDHVVLCQDCGGVRGDPFVSVEVRTGNFTIRHFGGSGWRWTRVIVFRYDTRRRIFVLHSDGGWSWNRLEAGSKTRIVNRLEDFDQLPFTSFAYEKVFAK
jgi:hypothetical protein